MSDRLAKEFQQYFFNASESNGERGWPYKCGWFDFLAGDRPETEDPLEMTIEAVWYLADCDRGEWTKPMISFQAAMAFLRNKYGFLPSPKQIKKIAELIKSPPQKDKLAAWFNDSYPESSN